MTPAKARADGFPRTARLLVPAAFKACFGSGRRAASRFFRAHCCVSGQPRLGLAVARKVDRRAVGRNRIKRIARESFRLARAGLPPLDIVLLARPEAARASSAELRADLAVLWHRVAALKRPEREGTMRADSAIAASVAIDSPLSAPVVAPQPGASRPTE
jgi:ribonuclease P protein component